MNNISNTLNSSNSHNQIRNNDRCTKKSGRLKTQVQTKPSNVTDSDFCIGFLNVCGLKRRIQCPEFLTFIKNHKILCFAETKLDSHDIISIDGYTYFNQPRRQSYIRKSGGLGFLVHDSIAKYVKRINTESDYIACLSLSRQYHHYEQDIILASVYIPPQQSRFFNQDEFELFERDIMSLRSQHDLFLMLGDFNAQTGTLDDFIPADNFLSDHFHFDDETVRFYDQKCELERLGIKTKRSSMDKKKNNTGYQLIDVCKNLYLCILNGRFGKDKNTGALTFRKASAIDYAIVTTKCFNLKYLNSLKRNKNDNETPNANEFFEYYRDMFASETHDDNQDNFGFDPSNAEEFLNRPFSSYEIDKCIRKLKNSKSPGLDNILNEYIKLTKERMLPLYTTLFNIILNTGNIPEQWLIGIIKPIYKNKGESTDSSNYRPITLLSCLGKLFTSLLSERLNEYVEENVILQENQAGFRKNYSTLDHIFSLHALIELMAFEKK